MISPLRVSTLRPHPSMFCRRWSKRFLLAASCASLMAGAGQVQAAPEENKAAAKPFAYDPAEHRDPFVSLVREGRLVSEVSAVSRAELAKPVLYGILWDAGGKSIAIINDLEAKTGDTIGGYRVLEIRRDSVVLQNASGEQMTLTIAFEAAPGASSDPGTGGGQR